MTGVEVYGRGPNLLHACDGDTQVGYAVGGIVGGQERWTCRLRGHPAEMRTNARAAEAYLISEWEAWELLGGTHPTPTRPPPPPPPPPG